MIFTLATSACGPLPVRGDATIDTSFVFDAGEPVVRAQWEINVAKDAASRYLGTDDDPAANPQFLPTGQIGVNKTIAVCAVVSDPDGKTDIDRVSARISYPAGVKVDASCTPTQSEVNLSPLTVADGMTLFCTQLRNNNPGLPAFNSAIASTYDSICNASTGDLYTTKALVYCGETNLAWADPAGAYTATVATRDKRTLSGTPFSNLFSYQALTAFETDFSKVNYGVVKPEVEKIVSGDGVWDTLDQGQPTIRNVGNTRVDLRAQQTDMGLGMTGDIWNVRFGSRLGQAASWTNYDPQTDTLLHDPLELAAKDSVDFSVTIKKPALPLYSYAGTMTLSGQRAQDLTCTP